MILAFHLITHPQYLPPSQVPLEPQQPRLNQQPHQFDQPDWPHQPQQPGPRGYLYQQDPTPRQAPVYPAYNQQQVPYQQPAPLSANTAMVRTALSAFHTATQIYSHSYGDHLCPVHIETESSCGGGKDTSYSYQACLLGGYYHYCACERSHTS